MQREEDAAAAAVRRLRRVAGQIGGVIRMIEANRDCADVFTQLAAASQALNRAGFSSISSRLIQCLADPESTEADRKAFEKLSMTLS
jgi:DNA-binding FrmR family transcriptional regulator